MYRGNSAIGGGALPIRISGALLQAGHSHCIYGNNGQSDNFLQRSAPTVEIATKSVYITEIALEVHLWNSVIFQMKKLRPPAEVLRHGLLVRL